MFKGGYKALDKSYLVEYEFRDSDNSGDQTVKTDKVIVEAISERDAQYQVTVKAIEELNRFDIRILYTRTVKR